MMVVEAVDENGVVDEDFDAVVLFESVHSTLRDGGDGVTSLSSLGNGYVHGKGLVRVVRGRGFVPMLAAKAGDALCTLLDGGFMAMEQAPPIRVTYRGATAAQIALVPEELEAPAGDGVVVSVEARDRFGNVATDVTCEVTLSATHGARSSAE